MTKHAARGLARSVSGLLLLAAVLCGLLAMHGLQPSSSPNVAPSVFALDVSHGDTAAGRMPSAHAPGIRETGIGQACPHDGHAGGQVCLAFLAAGAFLLLLAVSVAPANRSSIPSGRQAPPRSLNTRSRGPTLAQLSVLRL